MYLRSSALVIVGGANVLFANNRALAKGGAIFLSQSTIYLAMGANLNFMNNTAGDKGGAIYLDPGVTVLDNIISTTLDSNKCVLRNLMVMVRRRWLCFNRDNDSDQEEDINAFVDGYNRYPGRRAVNDKHADEATQPLLNSVRNAELQ